jgi:hypothetical protein
MALRVFTDRDGNEWNVWRVRPMTPDSPLHARFRDGWVCFQRVDGSDRCRMALDEMPPGWEALPDDRLDLLRRVASQPAGEPLLADTGEETRRTLEDSERGSVSGPRQVAGRDDEVGA